MKQLPHLSWLPTLLFLLIAASQQNSINAQQPNLGPKNGTVLIIRHAEKPPDGDPDPGLTPAGVERANKYVKYFQPFNDGGKSMTINYVFAAKDSHSSERPRLTVEPFVNTVGLPRNFEIKNDNYADLVTTLGNGQYDGKIILICWHHANIPALVDALGGDSKQLIGNKWNHDVFGWVVELTFGPDGRLTGSKVIDEHLMSDDTIPPRQAP